MKNPTLIARSAGIIAVAATVSLGTPTMAHAWQDSQSQKTPYGDLTANAWYDGGDTVGQSRKWNYAVSAKVGGKQAVELIKTTWTGSASMRNSANFSLSAGKDGVSAGGGSSWQYVSQTKYWSNNNGARTADYRSNMVASPVRDYRMNTVSLKNTAFVKFRGDARNWQITAAS